MPPMGPDPMMQEPPMGDMPQGDEELPDGAEGGSVGDSEGGPGSDVKKYSGELSQALNSYNEENPNDEEELNKYAINMIAAQVADSLSDKDKRKVIKKLNGDEDDMSSDEQPTPDDGQEPMPQMENRIVNEIVDELLNGRKGTKRDEKYITNNKVRKKGSPFASDR
jgi:ClpP class serine protease